MELQPEDGTQRLELPVSMTTLNVWGGEPRAISEKSIMSVSSLSTPAPSQDGHTLRVQVVANRYWMRPVALVRTDRSIAEHFVNVLGGTNAHILLSERLDMLIDVCILLGSD